MALRLREQRRACRKEGWAGRRDGIEVEVAQAGKWHSRKGGSGWTNSTGQRRESVGWRDGTDQRDSTDQRSEKEHRLER